MKKLITCLCSLMTFFFMGCASIGKIEKTTMSTELIGNPISGYNITVIDRSEFGDSWYQAAHKGQGFTRSFVVQIINESNSIGKIVWNNSSITDEDGTHRLFVEGTKYIKAEESIPDLIIPPGSKNKKTICSADTVKWSTLGKTWVIQAMKGFDFTVTLCINADGKDQFIVYKIKVQ